MIKSKRMLTIGITSLFLMTGCASHLSGVGGISNFACKAPPGTTCTSVAGVYANAIANNLPSQQPISSSTKPAFHTDHIEDPSRNAVSTHTPGIGSAIRSDARVLRLWLAPWEDREGDLHDQAYLYVTVDQGQWMIEHNRAPIRREYYPIKLHEQSPSVIPKTSSTTSKNIPPQDNESHNDSGDNNAQ